MIMSLSLTTWGTLLILWTTCGSGDAWKQRWIVTPLMLMAAIPVGAQTKTFFPCFSTVLSTNDLPVPAPPVKKIFSFDIIYSYAFFWSLVNE